MLQSQQTLLAGLTEDLTEIEIYNPTVNHDSLGQF